MSQISVTLALAGFSFLLTVIWGPPLLRVLRHFRIGKLIRVEGPERHFTKLGTLTMGGVLFILPVLLIAILMNASSLLGMRVLGRSILVPMAAMVGFGILGAIDDWEGLRGARKGLGMRARTKFALQVALALVLAFILYFLLDVPQLYLPGVKGEIEIGYWWIPIAVFVIVSSTNAINLTDGLDGMAGLITATAFVAYGGIALFQGQIYLARICFSLVGAIFGFLWFNVHPAQLFMGDVGALSLGATLAVVALMTGQWAILPVIIIVPVSIVLSDILQVGYFKITKGRRLFKMAPLHHHFELSGWSETQIVQRFWLISLLFALIGAALSVI
jgi:phospho-N-acetylmuramoyl-pentapeptide-transferase